MSLVSDRNITSVCGPGTGELFATGHYGEIWHYLP